MVNSDSSDSAFAHEYDRDLDNGDESRPTAFVSCSHDATGLEATSASEWEEDVVRFTTLLRTFGAIDADVDAFNYVERTRTE